MAILGIGAGSMELNVNKIEYTEGETITGRATIKLKENVKARGVYVEFWAEKKETDSDGDGTTTRVLHKQSLKLDEEREYRLGETKFYEFSFQIPSTILQKPSKAGGLLNGAINFFKNSSNKNISWYIQAKLDQPMAFDVAKKMKIIVKPQ
jgi:hypothetical protein